MYIGRKKTNWATTHRRIKREKTKLNNSFIPFIIIIFDDDDDNDYECQKTNSIGNDND